MSNDQTTLTKLELARRISEELGFSVRSSKGMVDDLFMIMKDQLNQGSTIKIVRFGSFIPLVKNARRGINPNTGEELTIPARKTVSFRPSPLLKKIINAGKGEKIL